MLKRYPVATYHNPKASPHLNYGPALKAILNEHSSALAQTEIASWPGFAKTPLVCLPGLAAVAGVSSIYYKDESTRFGLGSFKALGGAYAVYRLLRRSVEKATGSERITAKDLESGRYRELTRNITVCCATDGNHGRSVAWGARMFHCRCVIYLHQNVSAARESAIAHYGARITRVSGNYDDSVHRTALDAEQNGWTVISDTSYDGYTEIPKDVMHGYTVMTDEAIAALPQGESLTHVFVQGGVGGLPAAVCAPLWRQLAEQRPRFVVVEPENAACLYASAKARERVTLSGSLDTVMAGLSCGEPSLIAWEILSIGTNDFMTIPDDAAIDAMRLLADGVDGDSPIVGGESGVAGLAGMLAVAADNRLAQELALDSDSKVLVFGTEGDTDPELYQRIVGRSSEQVRRSGHRATYV
ncbi:MAG: diaminopropionate ammonia-lyase [Gammaproteobacteria bacterium]|nr:diaminopropionate ammonia-lyase [Gammaproteobacteria bacterium]